MNFLTVATIAMALLMQAPHLTWSQDAVADTTAAEEASDDVVTESRGKVGEDDVRFMVTRHNHYRGSVYPAASRMLKIKWDEEVAAIAQEYSQRCVYEHNPDLPTITTEKFSRLGENLFLTTNETDVMQQAVEQWASERHNYTYSTNKCEEGQVCSHYTQMVWADTHAIGCGIAECPQIELNKQTIENNFRLVVCNYGPAGNAQNVLPYKDGRWCSECEQGDGDYFYDAHQCVCASTALRSSVLVVLVTLFHYLYNLIVN